MSPFGLCTQPSMMTSSVHINDRLLHVHNAYNVMNLHWNRMLQHQLQQTECKLQEHMVQAELVQAADLQTAPETVIA